MTTVNQVCTIVDAAYKFQFASLIVSVFLQTAFVAMYSTVKWYNHFVGKALMANASGLWLVLIVIVFSRWLEYPGEQWLRAGAYWGLTTTIGCMVVALWKQQHDEKEIAPREAVD